MNFIKESISFFNICQLIPCHYTSAYTIKLKRHSSNMSTDEYRHGMPTNYMWNVMSC